MTEAAGLEPLSTRGSRVAVAAEGAMPEHTGAGSPVAIPGLALPSPPPGIATSRQLLPLRAAGAAFATTAGPIDRIRRASQALTGMSSDTVDGEDPRALAGARSCAGLATNGAADGATHFKLSVDGTDHEVSPDDAVEALRTLCRRVEAGIAGDEAGLESLEQAQRDQPVIAAISNYMGGGGLFGSLHLPDGSAWNKARGLLKEAQTKLEDGDVRGAAPLIQRASDEYTAAHATLSAYQKDSIGGAEHAVTGLRILEAAGAVAATVATGGTASAAGIGLLGTSAAIGGTAGLYGASQTEAEQTGQMIAGTRGWGRFDPVAILERGGTDAVVGFIGAFAGGKLAEPAMRAFGKVAMASMSPEELAAVARAANVEVSALRPEIFVGPLRRFVIDLFTGAATTPLTTAVQVTLAHLTGHEFPNSPDQFAEMVMQNAVQGGLTQIFIGGLTHGWTAAGLKTGFEPTRVGNAPNPAGSAAQETGREGPASGKQAADPSELATPEAAGAAPMSKAAVTTLGAGEATTVHDGASTGATSADLASSSATQSELQTSLEPSPAVPSQSTSAAAAHSTASPGSSPPGGAIGAALKLETIPGITPDELAVLNRLDDVRWARLKAYATPKSKRDSVKGKIAEALIPHAKWFATIHQRAVATAVTEGIPPELVRFEPDIRGLTLSNEGRAGLGELTDGAFVAEYNGRLRIFTVFESKSPSNAKDLSRTKGEFLGQFGTDFERATNLQTTVGVSTYEPDAVDISRHRTQWEAVLPPGESMDKATGGKRTGDKAPYLTHLQSGFPNVTFREGPVRDAVLRVVADRLKAIPQTSN